ncbi:MAG: SMC-Scp complex subunit ScpB [Kiritimatiellia bacterium]|nr:SMC-Scp complex subunit ScpB [Kiritimatiellia bacterium]
MSKPDEVRVPLPASLQQVVGSLLFGADHPLTVEEIRACLKSVAENAPEEEKAALSLFAEASPREVGDAAGGIAKELARLGLGIEVTSVSGAFRFQTQACCGRWVRNLLKAERPNRLSRPALETLAIIAYRQPIAKSEIESVRGVAVDHIVKALMELHLIRIVGRSELPGRPFLYGTTASFLDHFGLGSLKELNELDPTLQRSKPSERKALHRRERKPEEAPEKTPAAGKEAALPAPTDPAPAQPQGAVREILGGGAPDADAEPLYEA